MLSVQSHRSIKALPVFYAHNRRQLHRFIAASSRAERGLHDQRTSCTRHHGHSYNKPTTRLLHSTKCTLSKNANGENNLKTPNPLQSLSNDTSVSETTDSLAESFTDVPGTTNTKSKTLAIIYTCKVCDTRSAKQFTEHSYRHGVVLVRCPGCQNLHLIADRLGWFEDQDDDGQGWDVEKALAKAGENVKAVSHGDVLELTLDDIIGGKSS
ncbi:hypothetical protein ACHAXN_005606 [Cyclotella atomus]|jgi:protein import protein ZIM17